MNAGSVKVMIKFDDRKLKEALAIAKPGIRRYWRRHPFRYVKFRLEMRKHRKTWARLTRFFSP